MAREWGSRSIFWFWLGVEKLCIQGVEMKRWSRQIRGRNIHDLSGKGLMIFPRIGFHFFLFFFIVSSGYCHGEYQLSWCSRCLQSGVLLEARGESTSLPFPACRGCPRSLPYDCITSLPPLPSSYGFLSLTFLPTLMMTVGVHMSTPG